ncbi:tRNA guanosine(34) transglycosylase Tgt [Litorilinea aerophila]|uniref:tRNA guanosine(34) transglycosylase Tgt n=1 Tax=Litorilinea aerophila TaxID=1204385 RepID=A0A540VLP0_9CHLR|nr:tRNA guanosine(34) transglycosylase Tgt [Litorilinea aerophila]MCC9074892.1 tRNA guanosine(34) transglycosylase Tgt [Litorilinea aerophila]GIV76882.1 MAG: tRNA-guanine transglycosylase [Litorilinea sp.]
MPASVPASSAGGPPAAQLALPHGALQLPAFLPDATLGVVRAVDSVDLCHCGVQALVMNTFHLMQHPGSSTVQALGGLHQMCAWPRPIVTDSGGFQAYSLIRQNARYGSLTDNGILFRPEGSRRKLQLTPEKCVQLQLSYGADVVMCLDDCTHVDDPLESQEESVRRTILWARRCKAEFQRLLDQKQPAQRPLLFAVIQGGGSRELRRRCAEALLEMGFDGYGYGGWPLDSQGNLLEELLAYTRSLIPADYPMHALGVGHPRSIAACVRMGYSLFDSALPTRDARHGRLYVWEGDGDDSDGHGAAGGDRFRFLYINDARHIKDGRPLSATCDCLTCTHYARGYLHHLFKQGDTTYVRLATIHNLRFMARLMAHLRESHQSPAAP